MEERKAKRVMGKFARRLTWLAALVPWLVSAPAAAQTRDFGPFDVVGGGVFVGYTFGAKQGLDWGIEGFATRHFVTVPKCGNRDPRAGYGPLLRLSLLGVQRLSLTAASHVGGELSRSWLSGDAELGGSLVLGGGKVRGDLHTGLTVESIIFNVYARRAWLLNSTSVGIGGRFLPTLGTPGFCDE